MSSNTITPLAPDEANRIIRELLFGETAEDTLARRTLFDARMRSLRSLARRARREWRGGWNWLREIGDAGDGNPIYASGRLDLPDTDQIDDWADEHGLGVAVAARMVKAAHAYADGVDEEARRAGGHATSALKCIKAGAFSDLLDALAGLESAVDALLNCGDASPYDTLLEGILHIFDESGDR